MRLIVLTPIRHDGRDYAPGAVIEAPDGAAAAALIAAGAAREARAEDAPEARRAKRTK